MPPVKDSAAQIFTSFFIICRDDDATHQQYFINFSSSSLNFRIFDGGSAQTVSYSVDLRDDKWHHVAGTYDGSNLKLQFNFFVKGQQTSYTSQVPGNLTDLVNDQNEGFGFDVSYANPEGSWEVYYRYWSVENSEISPRATIAGVRYGFEPKNKTSEFGVRYRF